VVFAAASTLALHDAAHGIHTTGVALMLRGESLVFDGAVGLDPLAAFVIVTESAFLAAMIDAGEGKGFAAFEVSEVEDISHLGLSHLAGLIALPMS
jgi:hypothetical protein